MSDATVHRLPVTPRTPERHEPLRRRSRAWLGAAVAGAALIVTAVHAAGEQSRSLRRMPASERAHLYERTLQNLETVCTGDAKHGLTEFCQEQARFAIRFPQCGAVCSELARRVLHVPTR